MAQAKSDFALAHAARAELVLAHQCGAVSLDGDHGSCGGHGGGHGHGGGRGHAPCFLPVRRGLTSGFKGAKHIKHTRRAGDSCEDPVGDSNGGSGGGGGEAVVLVKEGRVEASPRGARSEKSVLLLLLLLLLLPPLPLLLLLLLLLAVGFLAPLADFCAATVASGAAKKESSALGQAARRCSATRCGWGGIRGWRRWPELPGYRAPLLRICSCVGQRYFFLEIMFLSVPVLLVKSTTIRILRKVAIAACF